MRRQLAATALAAWARACAERRAEAARSRAVARLEAEARGCRHRTLRRAAAMLSGCKCQAVLARATAVWRRLTLERRSDAERRAQFSSLEAARREQGSCLGLRAAVLLRRARERLRLSTALNAWLKACATTSLLNPGDIPAREPAASGPLSMTPVGGIGLDHSTPATAAAAVFAATRPPVRSTPVRSRSVASLSFSDQPIRKPDASEFAALMDGAFKDLTTKMRPRPLCASTSLMRDAG